MTTAEINIIQLAYSKIDKRLALLPGNEEKNLLVSKRSAFTEAVLEYSLENKKDNLVKILKEFNLVLPNN